MKSSLQPPGRFKTYFPGVTVIQDWTLGRLTWGSHSSHQSGKDAADWLMDCGFGLPLHSTAKLLLPFYWCKIKLNMCARDRKIYNDRIQIRHINLPSSLVPRVFFFLHVNLEKKQQLSSGKQHLQNQIRCFLISGPFHRGRELLRKITGRNSRDLANSAVLLKSSDPLFRTTVLFNLSELAFDLDPLWHG